MKYLFLIVSFFTLNSNAQKINIGYNHLLTVSYNTTDVFNHILPSFKTLYHLNYTKGNINLEAIAGKNFYETLTNSQIKRRYYTDVGLSIGVNNEEEGNQFILGAGVYYRIYYSEDLIAGKKPTRIGGMAVLGYQIKINENINAGSKLRVFKDYISNIKRMDQYNIQHFAISFFLSVNPLVIVNAIKNRKKLKRGEL